MGEEYPVVLGDQKIKNAFLQVADEATYTRELIFAKQVFDGNDYLRKCDPNSIRNAIFNIALTGATLNPALHQAYLVPRGGKCYLDFSYRGLIKIATESGGVLDVDATVVHEKDTFFYEQGLEPKLQHIPFLDGDPGNAKYVYAKAILPPFPPGIHKFIVLTEKEILAIEKASKAGSGPWKSDFREEMWRKSAVRKLYKMLPQTDRMSTAVSVLNEYDGIEPGRKAKEVMERFDDKEKVA